MTTLIGIAGSLRKGSFNAALLRAAAEAMPDGDRLLMRSIRGIPIYDGDEEAERGVPGPVASLKDEIASADGLLIVTPEYNNSIPGPLKNAIDWLSRPPSDIARVFRDKPVALMGASPGSFGTILSQNAWLPVLRTLRADHWSAGRLLVPRAGSVFDEDRRLADEKVADQLAQFIRDFSAYASAPLADGHPLTCVSRGTSSSGSSDSIERENPH